MFEVAGQGSHAAYGNNLLIDRVDTGVLEVLLYRFPNCLVEQPCLPQWISAFSTTRFARCCETSSCRTDREVAAVGDEQRFGCDRRAWRPAIRIISITPGPSDTKGMGKFPFTSNFSPALIQVQLYTVYLSPNSTTLSEPLYILSTSLNPFVRLTVAQELRRAAENELLKFSTVIDAAELYGQAAEALTALDTALGEDKWFFGAKEPGLLDATVFSYTHLLMDKALGKGWVDTRLRDALLLKKNLTTHRNRIIASYFADHA